MQNGDIPYLERKASPILNTRGGHSSTTSLPSTPTSQNAIPESPINNCSFVHLSGGGGPVTLISPGKVGLQGVHDTMPEEELEDVNMNIDPSRATGIQPTNPEVSSIKPN